MRGSAGGRNGNGVSESVPGVGASRSPHPEPARDYNPIVRWLCAGAAAAQGTRPIHSCLHLALSERLLGTRSSVSTASGEMRKTLSLLSGDSSLGSEGGGEIIQLHNAKSYGTQGETFTGAVTFRLDLDTEPERWRAKATAGGSTSTRCPLSVRFTGREVAEKMGEGPYGRVGGAGRNWYPFLCPYHPLLHSASPQIHATPRV